MDLGVAVMSKRPSEKPARSGIDTVPPIRVNRLRSAIYAGLLIPQISRIMQHLRMAWEFAIPVHWSYRGKHD